MGRATRCHPLPDFSTRALVTNGASELKGPPWRPPCGRLWSEHQAPSRHCATVTHPAFWEQKATLATPFGRDPWSKGSVSASPGFTGCWCRPCVQGKGSSDPGTKERGRGIQEIWKAPTGDLTGVGLGFPVHRKDMLHDICSEGHLQARSGQQLLREI